MGLGLTTTARWEHFEHAADMGVRGYGATPAQAFVQAALALTAVTTVPRLVRPETAVRVACSAGDIEMLLVDWLNGIIAAMGMRRMLFGRFAVRIAGTELRGTAWGEPIDPRRHQPALEVKAATYFQLAVRRGTDGLWMAQCVVDV